MTNPIARHLDARVPVARCAALALALLGLLAATPGCESEDPAEIRSYVDSAGRSCTVDLHDISATASCDADPASVATCSDGSEPAFVTHDDYDFETEISTLESCGACVDRAARTSFIISESCATVTCETDDDCLYLDYSCTTGGICQRT